MKNSILRFIVFFCFLLVSQALSGQNSGKHDSGSFPENPEQIKQDSEFGYMLYLDSLLRVSQAIKSDTINVNRETNSSKKNNNSSNNSISNYFLSTSGVSLFFQILAVLFILFLVYKLVLKNVLFSNRKNKYSTEINERGEPEILEASQYNSLINTAEKNAHFNLAIKYYFLQVLKKLDDLDVIQFSPDKTNQYYVYEIKNVSEKEKFASLARIYEYVWYGQFHVNSSQYREFKKEFEIFLSIID